MQKLCSFKTPSCSCCLQGWWQDEQINLGESARTADRLPALVRWKVNIVSQGVDFHMFQLHRMVRNGDSSSLAAMQMDCCTMKLTTVLRLWYYLSWHSAGAPALTLDSFIRQTVGGGFSRKRNSRLKHLGLGPQFFER
jgi:hypothetical protein